MRFFLPVVVIALVGSTATVAKQPMPTSTELAAALSDQTKKSVYPADVRPLKCEGFAEEPSEFECRWAQKVGGKWLRFDTYFAVERQGWIIIDWPPSKLK